MTGSTRFLFSAVAFLSYVVVANTQITLTGCHLHEGQEVCLLPGGIETTISTSSLSGSPSTTAPNSNPASTTIPPVAAATTTAVGQTTAITDCHQHGTTQYCVKGNGAEVQVLATATGTAALPTSYNGCHSHGTELFCVAPNGDEVEVVSAAAEEGDGHTEEEHAAGEHSDGAESEGQSCHFHAGVEHCTGGSESAATCERKDRDYNVKLRIGLLFVILFTSGIAVYSPMILKRLLRVNASSLIFTFIQQFGTGIIIATAFVHLLTHAELMFGNECLGELEYEATATSIAMAGAFLAFLVDYIAHRLANWRRQKASSSVSNLISSTEEQANQTEKTETSASSLPPPPLAVSMSHHQERQSLTTPNDAVSVLVLEAGIIFHSLLLGITLVVAGDSVFITLFIVIIFHQMFEGLALGARIAALPSSNHLQKTKRYILPLAFALVTPLGMAIGIGVLQKFNGNDPSTIVALGTLDSISAGILLWVGFVDMWAGDWLHGELRDATMIKTVVGMLSFVSGLVLMGLLGKWA